MDMRLSHNKDIIHERGENFNAYFVNFANWCKLPKNSCLRKKNSHCEGFAASQWLFFISVVLRYAKWVCLVTHCFILMLSQKP